MKYICPICGGDNHAILPSDLANLLCENCGANLDASNARIELIHPHDDPPPAEE